MYVMHTEHRRPKIVRGRRGPYTDQQTALTANGQKIFVQLNKLSTYYGRRIRLKHLRPLPSRMQLEFIVARSGDHHRGRRYPFPEQERTDRGICSGRRF